MHKFIPLLFLVTIVSGIAEAQDFEPFPGGVALDTIYNITISPKGPTYVVHVQILQPGTSYGRPTHYLVEFLRHLGAPPLQTIIDSAYSLPVFYHTSDYSSDADYCPQDPDFEPAVRHAIANNDFVQFLDMNFDGYMDLRVLHNEGSQGDFSYNYWLFRPRTSTFQFDSLLSYYCCHPALDHKHKIIASKAMVGWEKLQFKGTELLVIGRIEDE